MPVNQATAIIIPTYNEVENIRSLIKEIFKHLPQVQIIVVDDSSPDGTAQEVKRLQTKNKKIHLISKHEKSGRGQAVIAGLDYAYHHLNSKLMVEMDADFSHRPQELPDLISAVDQSTVAIGSRYMEGGAVKNWPFYRRWFSFISNNLLRLSIGLKLTDYTNGFRAYPREAVKELLKQELICRSYLTLTESALILKRAGFNLKEVPCVFPDRVRGRSNTGWKEIYDNFSELIKLRRHYF